MDNSFEYLPLNPGQKTPLATDWANRTFSREAYAKVTSNFGVKATDTHCILESDDAARLAELVGPIPETYTVQARDNRPHYYFLQTAATRAAGNMDVFGVFEFKQNRRYVVAEGSVHPCGAVYTRICDAPVAVMPDELVAKLIRLKKEAPPRKSAAEGRHPAIMEWCGKNFRGAGVDDDAFIQGAIDFDAENNNPARGHRHAAECARWYIDNEKEPAGAGPAVLMGYPKLDQPERADGEEVFVAGEFWFMLHGIHLVFGASGSGKTTWLSQLLEAQARGEEFFGHKTRGLPFIITMQDRSPRDMRQTLKRLNMPGLEKHIRMLPVKSWERDPASVLEEMYKVETLKPRVIVVEGIDAWTPDAKKQEAVFRVLKPLQEFAEAYNVAVICTAGSPKMKEHEQYLSNRDCAFGSQLWARMMDTMVRIVEDPETAERRITVMLRNAPAEKFAARMENGRLTTKTPIKVEITPTGKSTKIDSVKDWLAVNPNATWEQTAAAFHTSKRTVERAGRISATRKSATSKRLSQRQTGKLVATILLMDKEIRADPTFSCIPVAERPPLVANYFEIASICGTAGNLTTFAFHSIPMAQQ